MMRSLKNRCLVRARGPQRRARHHARRRPVVFPAAGPPEFGVPVRHQVCLRDAVDGHRVGPAVGQHPHDALADVANRAHEISPPLGTTLGLVGADLHFLPGEAPEVLLPAQRSFNPRRAHLQPVGVLDVVGYIQRRRNVATDPFTVLEADSRAPGTARPARWRPAGAGPASGRQGLSMNSRKTHPPSSRPHWSSTRSNPAPCV